MDPHPRFTSHLLSIGAKIHSGITPAQIPNRGIGIVATEPIKAGTVLLSIPAHQLLTADSALLCADPRLEGCRGRMSMQGRVAMALTLAEREEGNGVSTRKREENLVLLRKWARSWPTEENVRACMPLAWGKERRDKLPADEKDRLRRQRAKLNTDWAGAKSVLGQGGRKRFEYYWLLVNSRCFHWPYASKEHGAGHEVIGSADDLIAMVPWADYLNHVDVPECEYEATGRGCSITGRRDYKPGEEVLTSYGWHSNAFLLVEYGFVLSENRSDNLILDYLLLPKLSSSQKHSLDGIGYLGGYILQPHNEGVCFRTEIAVRSLWASSNELHELATGEDSPLFAQEQSRVNAFVAGLLGEYHALAVRTLEELDTISEESAELARELLIQRWMQIRDFITSCKYSSVRAEKLNIERGD